MDSTWVDRELNAFVMQAMAHGKPILPCRVDDATPPALIADLKYADFRESFESGMISLFGALAIMEEIALATAAKFIATEIYESLTEDERHKCWTTFARGKGSLNYNVFTLPNGRLNEILSILRTRALLEDHDDGDTITVVGSPLGNRVFEIWHKNSPMQTH